MLASQARDFLVFLVQLLLKQIVYGFLAHDVLLEQIFVASYFTGKEMFDFVVQVIVRAWLNTVLFFNTLEEIVWTEHFMEFGPDFWRANAYLKRSSVWV